MAKLRIRCHLYTLTEWGDLAEVTKTTSVVTGNITHSLYFQVSKSAMASLTAMRYNDHLACRRLSPVVEKFDCSIIFAVVFDAILL